MDVVDNLTHGFLVALALPAIVVCVIAALVGVFAAALPGISPAAALALALPATFFASPMVGLGGLVALAVGMACGRGMAALELSGAANAPGGGPLSIALAALAGGVVSVLLVAVLAPLAGTLAFSLTPAEYAALMVGVLAVAISLAPGSFVTALAIVVLGLLLSMVGIEVNTGALRLTFGVAELADGIGAVPIALGLFAVADIIRGLGLTEMDRAWRIAATAGKPPPGLPGATLLGFVAGLLPASGMALTIAANERDQEAPPDALDPAGQETAEHVASAAAAGNARLSGAFAPLLALGVPTNAVTALIVFGMMIQGIAPGPQVAVQQPDLYWGLLATIIVANAVVLVVVLAAGKSLLGLARLDYRGMAPLLLVACCLAAYSVNNSVFDIAAMLIFGAVGYLLLRSNCERGLLLIAFTMGPLLEENIRRAMLLARGDFQAILARPIVAAMLVTALVLGFIGRKLLHRSPGAEPMPVPVPQPAVRVPAPPLNWGRVIVVGVAAFAFVPIVAMQLMMIAGAPRETIGPVTLVSQLAVLALIVAYVRRRRSAQQ